MVIIKIYNSKILLSLHYFLTPQFQTFTNLLIGIFGVSNPTFFLLRFLINYVSIIVNIISNNTVLQCYSLRIFVSIRRLLQLILCIGVSTPPPPQKHNSFFCKVPSKIYKIFKPPFLGDLPPPLSPYLVSHGIIMLKITGCCCFFGFRGN